MNKELREKMSAILMDTSEEKPMRINVTVGESEAMGLSSLELPKVESAFQMPSEGIIYFNINGCKEPIEFDNMAEEDLKAICKAMEEQDEFFRTFWKNVRENINVTSDDMAEDILFRLFYATPKEKDNIIDEYELQLRVCDNCGALMCEGYLNECNVEHFCSTECMINYYEWTEEDYKKWEREWDWYDPIFWTEWCN